MVLCDILTTFRIELKGIDTGLSQMSRTSALHSEPGVIWNFPIDVKFKSTNVHGWPRVALSVSSCHHEFWVLFHSDAAGVWH